jgi:hypothetical protein
VTATNNPQAPQDRDSADMLLEALNYLGAPRLGILSRVQVRAWAAGLSPEREERILQLLWWWDGKKRAA